MKSNASLLDDIDIKSDLDAFDVNIVEYISGFCAKSVAMQSKCDKCFKFLLKQDSSEYKFIQFKEKYCLLKPRKEFVNLCKISEQIMKLSITNDCLFEKHFYARTVNKIVRKFAIENNDFFPEMLCNGHDAEQNWFLLSTFGDSLI